jgi:hypothetical protein
LSASRHWTTGAAQIRFRVNTPAAEARLSHTTRPRSGLPFFRFNPQCRAAVRKPGTRWSRPLGQSRTIESRPFFGAGFFLAFLFLPMMVYRLLIVLVDAGCDTFSPKEIGP